MRTDHHLGIGVGGIELKHALVIVACADSIAQRRKPCAFDEPGVDRKLGTRNAAAIKCIDVCWIGFEPLVFQAQGAMCQLFDAILGLAICRTGGASYKTIVRVVSGVHRTCFVEIAHENHCQEMIHRERVVGMLANNLLKFLCRPDVVHVVEVIECHLCFRIVRRAMSGLGVGCYLRAGKRAVRHDKSEERNEASTQREIHAQTLLEDPQNPVCLV